MTDRPSSSYPSPPRQLGGPDVPFYQDPPNLQHHDKHVEDDDAALERHIEEQLTQHINPDLHHASSNEVHDASLMSVDGQNQDAQALAQEVMNLNDPHMTSNHSNIDNTNAGANGKTRSKVSRACDECRRKKVRCDAPLDGTGSCTACKKNSINCQFSRTPQKRGPSKGYIKDLADRVLSLEQRDRGSAVALTFPVDAFSSTVSQKQTEDFADLYTRSKRTRSSSDAENNHYSNQDRNGFPPSDSTRTQPQPQPSPQPQLQPDSHDLKLDDVLISTYLQYVHPVLPVLPATQNLIQSYFDEMPITTRTALIAAMNLSLKSLPYNDENDFSSINPEPLLAAAEQVDPPHLARSQFFVFLTLSAYNRGRDMIDEGHFINNSVAKSLTMAIEYGYNPNIFDTITAMQSEQTPHLNLSRSLGLSISIMDVMNSLALRRPGESFASQAPSPIPRDFSLVGPRLHAIAKMASKVSQSYQGIIINTEPKPLTMPTGKITLNTSQRGLLELYRQANAEFLNDYSCARPEDAADVIVQLSFWYYALANELYFYPVMDYNRLLDICRNTVESLSLMTSTHPLLHHFSGLVANTLLQIVDFHQTRSIAQELLESLEGVLMRLVPAEDRSFDGLVRSAVSNKRQEDVNFRLGLEQLADVAVGEHSSDSVTAAAEAAAKAAMGIGGREARDWDPSLITREGYLLALSR